VGLGKAQGRHRQLQAPSPFWREPAWVQFTGPLPPAARRPVFVAAPVPSQTVSLAVAMPTPMARLLQGQPAEAAFFECLNRAPHMVLSS
jgi:hypothetical protein